MTDRKNMSIMELAHQMLSENGKAMSFLELYDNVCAEKGVTEDEKAENISQVYSDFITSAKFIYVGDDEWDIKGRQTIDLWDKDGAYYDEYPDYEEELSLFDEKADDEYSIDEEVVEEDEEDEEEKVYEDDFDEDDIEDDSEYDAFVEEDEDYIEDEEDLIFDEDDEEIKDMEETEEIEEAEEFDDEEYNEYMDDYEEMYED